LTGFEVLHAVPATVSTPLVVFVTGYDQHALAAFDAHAVGYLLKPVEAERLAPALERARRLNAFTDEREKERAAILNVVRAAQSIMRHVVCRKGDRVLLTPPDQILWFEMNSGIVRARTTTESFWVNYQLNELEAALPSEMFFRARREVLVNIGRIKEIRPYFKSGFRLIMSDAANTEITVSERRAKPLRLRVPGL